MCEEKKKIDSGEIKKQPIELEEGIKKHVFKPGEDPVNPIRPSDREKQLKDDNTDSIKPSDKKTQPKGNKTDSEK